MHGGPAAVAEVLFAAFLQQQGREQQGLLWSATALDGMGWDSRTASSVWRRDKGGLVCVLYRLTPVLLEAAGGMGCSNCSCCSRGAHGA